jgi:pimeloyl-ACP methyl ester carboxylesterase
MIQYDVRGKGEPVLVFVHCWCCDRGYWAAQVDTFAQKYRVVTIDLAGHGESGMNREEWTIAAFGADVKAVVEKLQLDKVILIGHSMGGPVIIDAASRMPERIVGLIGVDTFQNFDRRLTPEQIDGILAPFRENFKESTSGFIRSMFPATADSVLVEWVVNDMSSSPAEVGIGAMEGMFQFDPRDILKETGVPIRSINADMWPTDVEGNQKHALSFEAEIMEGYGHFLHMEDPETFNRLLERTIQELTQRASSS